MARRKIKRGKVDAEDQLRLAGYPTATAHGVSKDHPDETVEQWADRVRGGSAEQVIREQREAALAGQAEASKESGNG